MKLLIQLMCLLSSFYIFGQDVKYNIKASTDSTYRLQEIFIIDSDTISSVLMPRIALDSDKIKDYVLNLALEKNTKNDLRLIESIESNNEINQLEKLINNSLDANYVEHTKTLLLDRLIGHYELKENCVWATCEINTNGAFKDDNRTGYVEIISPLSFKVVNFFEHDLIFYPIEYGVFVAYGFNNKRIILKPI